MSEKISIIIPTYKRPGMVVKAINCCFKQSYQDFCIYVIDDNNEDDYRLSTANEMKQYEGHSQVVYIQHEENMGSCNARNTGIVASKGEYLAFLDDDDLWHEEKLAKVIDVFNQSDHSMGLVFTARYEIINHEKYLIKAKEKELEKASMFLATGYNFIGSISFVIIKRSVLTDVGFFDDKMMAWEDIELYLRISRKYAIGYVDEPLATYYVHDSERITTNITKIESSMAYFEHKHIDLLKNNTIKSGLKFKQAVIYLTLGAYQKSRHCAYQSLKMKPRVKPLLLFLLLSITNNPKVYDKIRLSKLNRKIKVIE